MITRQVYYVMLICMALFLFSLTSCKQQRGPMAINDKNDLYYIGGCAMSNNLKEIWSMINKESIRRIIILGSSSEPVEIPQECLDGYIEVLDKAINKVKMKQDTNIQQDHRLKIITDTNEYIIPCEWLISGEELDLPTYMDHYNYLEGCEVWQKWSGIVYDTTGWTKLHSPRKMWPTLKKENIRKIIFCYGVEGYEKADDWPVMFEVPQSCLGDTIELLDKALHEQKNIYKIPNAWQGFSGMKIITDKGKYLIPAGRSRSKRPHNDTIYGADWASSELKEYLRNCGWADPNN
jgi:hypothetical protein